MHGIHAVGQVLALGKAVFIAGQVVPLRILCRLIAAGRFQINGEYCTLLGSFDLRIAVIRVLDDGDIALLHLLAHSHGRRSVQLNGVIGRLCTDRINGAVQQIALGGADLTNRPVVAADIIAGGELAVLVGVVGIHKLIALIDAVGGTGKRSVALRRSDLTVTLSDGDIEFLEDVGKALIGYTVPFHCGALAVGNHIANGGVHLLQCVAGADEHIPESRHTVFLGDGVFIYRQTAEGGSKKVELHALIQSVLGGFGHGKLAAAEHIVEGNRRRLSGKHGNTVAFLGLVFVIALLGDGSLGLFVCIGGHNCAALLDVRNQRQTILVHKYRDFCENLILGNILVTVATLVLLDDLHLLSDSGKFLINVHLFCHFTPPLNMSLPCRQDATGAPVCYAQKSYQ